MALIAINAVVDVVLYALMIRVRLALRVAIRAGKHRVVVRVGMTGGADAIGSAVIRGEPCVVKDRAQPRRRVMARLARCREACRLMIGVGRAVVVRLMAAVASRRQSRVVVVHVALRTWDRDVEAREWERGQIVVKRRLQPRRRVVAHLASVGESDSGVGRIVGAVIVRHVAGRARWVGQVVVPIHVTLRAGSSQMHTG